MAGDYDLPESKPKKPRGFQKGHKFGKGRPVGSGNTLHKDFLHALNVSFQRRGLAAIERLISSNPSAYLYLIASLKPKELNIDVSIDVNSEPISELNRWLESVTRATRTIEGQNTLQDRPILPATLCIEQTSSGTPVDIEDVPNGTGKPEWMS